MPKFKIGDKVVIMSYAFRPEVTEAKVVGVIAKDSGGAFYYLKTPFSSNYEAKEEEDIYENVEALKNDLENLLIKFKEEK